MVSVPPAPLECPHTPLAVSPARGRSRAEDRHGVPETKSRLLAHRPHCSHRASSRPPFPGSQHPQITAFPRGGNGDPASLVAGSRAVLLRRDSSRESRLVDGRDLVSAPFSFSLSSPFSACVFLFPPSASSLSRPEGAFCRAEPHKSQTSPERQGLETKLSFFPK